MGYTYERHGDVRGNKFKWTNDAAVVRKARNLRRGQVKP